MKGGTDTIEAVGINELLHNGHVVLALARSGKSVKSIEHHAQLFDVERGEAT